MQRPNDSAVVFFPGALGDLVCFTPALLGLRARHRGTLALVARPTLSDLLMLPGLERLSIDRREVADLFNPTGILTAETRSVFADFAAAYSWTGSKDPTFLQRLAAATGGQVSVFPFRDTSAREHASAYYSRCVGVASCQPSPEHFRHDAGWLDGLPENQRAVLVPGVLVVHPGSGSPSKNWSGYPSLIRHWLQRPGGRVALLCGPAESEIGMEWPAGAVGFQGLTLPQVVTLLRTAALYVGNDSGIGHLAGVLGVPGAVLFGASDPAVWAPLGGTVQVVRGCNSCPRCPRTEFCVHRLPVAVVMQVLERMEASTQR